MSVGVHVILVGQLQSSVHVRLEMTSGQVYGLPLRLAGVTNVTGWAVQVSACACTCVCDAE